MKNSHIRVALALLLLFSCEKGGMTDCSKCDTSESYLVQLMIYIRNSDYVPLDPSVTIYEGAIEDSIVLDRIIVNESYTYVTYDAILYKDYSASVEFTLDGRKYVSVGAASPKVRYDETTCDQPCYYVYDNVIDLSLRYH
jgi:hypothetical protein